MKNLMGVMEGGSIPALSGLEDALKAEQKVSSISSSSSSSARLTSERVVMDSCKCILRLHLELRGGRERRTQGRNL